MQLESLRCDFGRSNLAFEHIQKINFAQIGNNISQTKSWEDLKNKEKQLSKRFATFRRKKYPFFLFQMTSIMYIVQ